MNRPAFAEDWLVWAALLRKAGAGRGFAFPGRDRPMGRVTGVPSAVWRLRMAMRIRISAVWRSKARHRAAIGPRPLPNGHRRLAEPLHAVRLGLGAAAAVVAFGAALGPVASGPLTVAHAAIGDLERSDGQGARVHRQVDLAPDAPAAAAVLARVPCFGLSRPHRGTVPAHPSPRTLMPVLSTSRCSGPPLPR